ncbi:hypothetical protein DPMN_074844 [Dreissena polymorpha]|uniref:Uncharacterized protein n=1 Tax=Dreissena polymorpha TaxID=45954 RepID=A0A9D3YG40_DREPO|nr:hypothetical protein DPMN_074844 [Dreissena polymorpha]
MLEYQNEPTDIDEAMFHVVNFIQSRGNPRSNGEKNHRNKKWTRRTTECMVADIEDEETSETANRVPSRITREDTPQKNIESSGNHEGKCHRRNAKHHGGGNHVNFLKNYRQILMN